MLLRLLRAGRMPLSVAFAVLVFGVTFLAQATPTTTTVNSSPNPSVYGQTVTFTVAVGGVTTPSGTVTLKEGATSLGSKDLATEASATVDIDVSTLSVGTHSIVAEYSGDVAHGYEASASDELNQIVNERATSTTVTGPYVADLLETDPVYVNQPLEFRVTVADESGIGSPPSFDGDAGLVTWTVTLPGGLTELLYGTVDQYGDGTIDYVPADPSDPSKTPANFTITAHYEGNAAYEASSSDGSQGFSVAKRTTTTTVSGDAAGVVDEPLTFNVQVTDDQASIPDDTSPSFDGMATVTWSSDGAGTFGDGGVCVVDSTGQCTMTYTPSATGAHVITATYAGNEFYVDSTSDDSHSVDVDKRETSTTAGGPTSGFVNEVLTFTVQVNDTSAAGGTSPSFDSATNQVTWTIDEPGVGVATLTGDVDGTGAGSIVYTPSATGSYSISANYEGNDYYLESAPDGSWAFTVNKRTTSTTVDGPTTGCVNEVLTFAVQVNDTSVAGGTAPSFEDVPDTNQVTWTIDEPGVGVTTLTGDVDANGAGSIDYTPSATGSYSISADYEGNDYYLESAPDGSRAFAVGKRTTNTTVGGPTAGCVNEVLTFTVQVNDTSAAGGTSPSFDAATNQVTWTVDEPGIGVTTLVGDVDGTGAGSITYTPSATGSYSISAHYEGNSGYDESSPDGSKAFVAGRRATSTTVTVATTTPYYVRQQLTFSATVSDTTSAGGAAPSFDGGSGLVTWTVTLPGGSTDVLQGTVDQDGDGTITYTPPVASDSLLTPQGFTITAHYTGNEFYAPSSSDDAETFAVLKRPVTVTVGDLSGTVYVDQPWTVAVLVSQDTIGGVALLSPADLSGDIEWSSTVAGAAFLPGTEGTVSAAGQGTVTFHSTTAGGSGTITALYAGNATFESDSDSTSSFVEAQRSTSTTIAGPAGSIPVNLPFAFQVQVSDTSGALGTPSFAGTVQWTVTYAIDSDPDIPMTETASGTVDSSGYGSFAYTPLYATTALVTGYKIEAAYGGNTSYTASSDGPDAFTVAAATTPTITTLSCSETPLVVGGHTYCTATVTTTDGTPVTSGMVYFTRTPASGGSFSPTTRMLDVVTGQATVTYTATSGDTNPHVLRATYGGYSGVTSYDTSYDTFNQEIEKRAADVVMTVSPSTAYIFQDVTVTVHVADDTTAGDSSVPTGTVTFSDETNAGVFSLDTVSLSDGAATTTYTPGVGDAGIITITATYAGSAVHEAGSLSEKLTVELRPTRTTVTGSMDTLLVWEPCTYTVLVEDIADAGTATPPTGTLTYSSHLGADASIVYVSGTNVAPWAIFTYKCLGLPVSVVGGYDVVIATYAPDDDIHAESVGDENNRAFGQAIQKRPTVTSIGAAVSTATGATFTATTVEDPANPGTPQDLSGNLHLLEPDTLSGGITGDSIGYDFEVTSGSPLINATVMYEPTDKFHLASTASENIDRTEWFDADQGGDGTTGAECDDGCGAGGTDIENAIYALNATEVALEAVKSGLEVVALVLDIIPDPVTAAGCVVVGGATIPVSDIAKAVVAGAGIALDIAILAMDTDLDDDGLPDVIEETITHTDPFKVDSDGDGMGDLDEIDEAGGFYGGTRRPDPNNSDSDGDGLGDGEEVSVTHTNFCVADTDCDTVSDGAEVGTWSGLDIRDQLDPLMQDTDGDGLTDYVEYGAGKLAASIADTTYSPYGNCDDSDGDGIQDGMESTDGDAVWDYTQIGSSGTTGSGETHLCLADTDGDGLSDGEEEALFGRGPTTVHSTLGTITTPALDDDSDDDGLSDYEEQVITHTDPLNWDSDGDSLSDANELKAIGGVWPARRFAQVSDPLDPDTDDDELLDNVEYNGTGLGPSHGLGGSDDTICPIVNDDDSDDDGLQDGIEDADRDGKWDPVVKATSTTQNPIGETDLCNPDTDGDGLTDGEEVALFGGLPISAASPYLLQAVSTTAGATIPALDDDSDNDGLSDYEEVNITGTNALDSDTDDDNISDANELIATGTWPKRAFEQESDPLDPDTDDDYLQDDMEYKGTAFQGTGLGISRTAGGTPDNICPYVNDADSDDDGLQDGVEDANKDGTYGVNGAGMKTGGIGSHAGYPNKNSAPYWETDLCNPDTDGDGLLDGEEVGLLGGEPLSGRPGPGETFTAVLFEQRSTTLPVGSGPGGLGPYSFSPTSGARTTATVPALDIDSDDDGLSDYEEVNITGTDPLDQDSDNDTLMDADELIATGGVAGGIPRRSFDQESDPLDINTDDDHLFDPQEYAGSGLSSKSGGLSAATDRDVACPFVNDDDSDNDGIQDGAVIHVDPALTVTGSGNPTVGYDYSYTHYEDFVDISGSSLPFPGQAQADVGEFDGEQQEPDIVCNVCDSDSDGDGLNDGEEIAIGTNPDDCDTDDDGRNDWHEVTGGGPIPTDPFDPDTDDDGLLDSAEVFGSNPTNPVNADTDGDGLCDGGAGTPWMTSTDVRVVVNRLCKSCSTPGLDPCGTSTDRWGSLSGIGDHPNLRGFGEDQNGNGVWDAGETDPNQYDTDGDAIADGIERLAFSTSRQYMIPTKDLFGRPIYVTYPDANNLTDPCGCLDPLNPDSDGDGLTDGYEDANHDGNFDFLPSDFDIDTSSVETSLPDPEETNPCMADTDGDELSDWEERFQRQPLAVNPPVAVVPIDNDLDGLFDEDPPDGIDNDLDHQTDEDGPENIVELTFNPTNPLDWDTDNDWLSDGQEVHWPCVATEYTTLDNDSDGYIDEDPIDGLDNDGDGLFDEDPVDFWVRFVPMLDPTNRDSDSDGFIDGLDEDPCNSEMIPVLFPALGGSVDWDGDGFSDDDEIAAGTHPNDPEDHPTAYGTVDVDFDECIDDRIWLEPGACCGEAGWVVVDLDNNVLIDLRIAITSRSVKHGDLDGDGNEDDIRYTVEYVLSDYRAVQLRAIATIDDYNSDLVIDRVVVERK